MHNEEQESNFSNVRLKEEIVAASDVSSPANVHLKVDRYPVHLQIAHAADETLLKVAAQNRFVLAEIGRRDGNAAEKEFCADVE